MRCPGRLTITHTPTHTHTEMGGVGSAGRQQWRKTQQTEWGGCKVKNSNWGRNKERLDNKMSERKERQIEEQESEICTLIISKEQCFWESVLLYYDNHFTPKRRTSNIFSLSFSYLRQLDYNQISCIEDGAFRALRDLEVL